MSLCLGANFHIGAHLVFLLLGLTSLSSPSSCRENASESLSDMSTLLHNFREKTQRGALVRPEPLASNFSLLLSLGPP